MIKRLLKRVFILVLSTSLLLACSSPKNNGEDIPVDVANSLFTQLSTSIGGLRVSSSSEHLYIVDGGILYAYDNKSKEVVELSILSVVDDERYDGYSDYSSKKYSDIMLDNYFQYLNDNLYYISEYSNSEGEEKVSLNKITPDGSQISEVYVFDTLVSDVLITEGFVLYRDPITQQRHIVNLSNQEISKLDLPNNLIFFDYLITNDKTYIIGLNESSEGLYLLDINFNTLEIKVVDGPVSGYVNYGYDDTILTYRFEDESLIYGDVKRIEGETLHRFENKVLYTIDKDYVYVGNSEDPQKYEIYTHDGVLKYTVEVPDGFEPNRMIHYSEKLSVSGVLGIYDNRLFVIGHKDGKAQYYLVDYTTNDWELIFESKHLVEENR